MSKKIDAALKDLIKALKKHGEVVGERRVSLKRSQRATAKLRTAANAYAVAVHAKAGLGNPFDDLIDLALDAETVKSLEAERDALARERNPSSSNDEVESANADASEGEVKAHVQDAPLAAGPDAKAAAKRPVRSRAKAPATVEATAAATTPTNARATPAAESK